MHEPSLNIQTITLSGFVERVTFYSADTGYCVLRMKVKDFTDLVTCVGLTPELNPGCELKIEGQWVQNRDYGRQFQIKELYCIPPSSLEGIERYLASGMVQGIGPHFAKKLVQNFGKDVFSVIEQEPARLKSIAGIGAKRIEKICTAWQSQQVLRSIIVFLQSHGVSSSRAVRIYKTYGEDSIKKLQENPYQLARDIRGIGFKSADQIAFKLGISKNSVIRAEAGLSYTLLELSQKGHCAYPEESLILESQKLLESEPGQLQKALENLLQSKQVVRQRYEDGQNSVKNTIQIASLHYYEKSIAEKLHSLKTGPLPWGQINNEQAIQWAQLQMSLRLAQLQKLAIETALKSKLCIITGGPGTGKSTLTRSLINILENSGLRIALASPTGKAAKRLSECTGREAKTLHRTLAWDRKKGGFLRNADNPLPIDFLLIDEASMVDIRLAHSVLQAVPKHAAVLFIGDVNQLPSVGPGQFLADLIQSGLIAVVRLREIFRQSQQSKIVRVAHKIQEGKFPVLEHEKGSDFYFLECESPKQCVEKIIHLVKERIPQSFGFDPVNDIQVLCPMQRGSAGARQLNQSLQQALNPKPRAYIERFGYRFCIGDKVMVIQNNYDLDVFNGDSGIIKEIDIEDQSCQIQLEDRHLVLAFDELDLLQPAYTITIHKSQGSEYPVVIIPLLTQHFPMLKQNLIYTGITRGKKLVVLVGQKKALHIALKNLEQGARFTHLEDQLRSVFKKNLNLEKLSG